MELKEDFTKSVENILGQTTTPGELDFAVRNKAIGNLLLYERADMIRLYLERNKIFNRFREIHRNLGFRCIWRRRKCF
uniref:Uncharacterized protein n=1 Tax=Pithovirus LCDPAC01 TaxID=2506600 RepID=A0A481YQJ8_9VIRU|nr:MAG: hypothetical protein LCDPAC01_01820 [Pithovirus LCDPAC01]